MWHRDIVMRTDISIQSMYMQMWHKAVLVPRRQMGILHAMSYFVLAVDSGAIQGAHNDCKKKMSMKH